MRVSSLRRSASVRLTEVQVEEPLVYGDISSFRDDHEDFPRDHLLRMQGSSGNFCTFNGNRSFFWQDGRDPGAGLA